jgi:hypothetical protein
VDILPEALGESSTKRGCRNLSPTGRCSRSWLLLVRIVVVDAESKGEVPCAGCHGVAKEVEIFLGKHGEACTYPGVRERHPALRDRPDDVAVIDLSEKIAQYFKLEGCAPFACHELT